MKIITDRTDLRCDHGGKLNGVFSSDPLVKIDGASVLVDGDLLMKPVSGCPNIGATIKPCMLTLTMNSGRSSFIKINHRSVLVDTATGITDGTPPGVIKYSVFMPNQGLVEEIS